MWYHPYDPEWAEGYITVITYFGILLLCGASFLALFWSTRDSDED